MRVCTVTLVALLIGASTLQAQQATYEGDGRVHGAEVMPVVRAPLRPGQVTTLNLHPYEHSVIEFPYPIVRIDGGVSGDSAIFVASKFGNKMTITATKLSNHHTTMSVVLGDADLTTVPYNVTTDRSKPMPNKIVYYDSAATMQERLTDKITGANDIRIKTKADELAERIMRDRLLMASQPTEINKEANTGPEGNKLTLFIESAQSIPTGEGQGAKLYIRYRFVNGGRATVEDLHFSARRAQESSSVFGKEQSTDIYDLDDSTRTAKVIPGGTAIIGLVIMDQPDLHAGERLDITAKVFRDQQTVTVVGALSGPEKR